MSKYTLDPSFCYAMNEYPNRFRANKHYEGLFSLTRNDRILWIDCNHTEVYQGVKIPHVRPDHLKKPSPSEVKSFKEFFARKVKEYRDKNTDKEDSMGFVEDAKKKHQEQKPGRDMWTPQVGDVRVIKVEDKRVVPVVIIGKDKESEIFDILDIETEQHLAIWAYARLINAFEIGNVYVVEYNGKTDKGHSFWITDVTEDYKDE